MSDIYGPAHIYVARAHPEFCDWLPSEPHVLDSLTGGQLAIAGEMPLLCSEGFNSASGLELLALAGLKVAPIGFISEPAKTLRHFQVRLRPWMAISFSSTFIQAVR